MSRSVFPSEDGNANVLRQSNAAPTAARPSDVADPDGYGAKILEEQQRAKDRRQNPLVYRMHPQLLIHEATINKVAQKQAAAKYFAAKKRQEREEKRERDFVRRTVTPPDFAQMDADTVVKLADFMPVVPAEFDRAFRYGTLTAPVDVHSDSVYSLDDILIIGAQLELATLRAHLQQKSV